MISSKTDQGSCSKKDKKVDNLVIYSNHFILNNKAIFFGAFAVQNSKKSLFSTKFFSFISRIKMIFHSAEKDQGKHFPQN